MECSSAACEPEQLPQAVQKQSEDSKEPDHKEFDFVERPSEDFFCPVTFELLLDPHQTTCCGNHLSQRAVLRLQRDGKPCPMCKEPHLTTMPDKFHKRRVIAVRVRCPHSPSGCEWVGEVGVAKQHADGCPKRPWKCQYCNFSSTSEAEGEHKEQCTKYPVVCPNECDVGTIPRCDVEKHRAKCPLEFVTCEFVDVGCDVKMTRQDLKHHMEESQQQHLLTATLLNLKLTRETIAEKDRQIAEKDRQLAEKDECIAEKDRQLAEKDKQLAGKDRQLAETNDHLAEKGHQIEVKDNQLVEKDEIIAQKDRQQMKLHEQLEKYQNDFMGTTKVALDRFLGVGAHHFILTNFSSHQTKGSYGDWFSDPFYSHAGGYHIKLNVETMQKAPFMKIRLYNEENGDNTLDWPVTLIINLELLNQLGQHHHYSKEMEIKLYKRENFFNVHSQPQEYILFTTLRKKGEYIQYLQDDCLKFRMWIRVK